MYIYTPLCRYWIALYRYVLVFIVPHVDIELEDNKQFISNIPRNYRIQPNYCTCSYKRTVKQLSNLKDYNQCTFIYFFMKKTYVVGTHLNCLDKSRQFKQVSTTYDSIKKTENNIA